MATLNESRGTMKMFRAGTHRTMSPAQTLQRLQPLLPSYGITRVANLTGLDRIGLPVVMVCRPNARSSAVFHGKGLDLHAAKASGIMEAIETWYAENALLPMHFASRRQLSGALPLAAVEQMASIPQSRYHADLPLLWVEAEDLIGGGPCWLPFEAVHMNLTQPAPPSSGCFSQSTNGLASGNCKLEAASHALCEVIERDATTLWRGLSAADKEARGVRLESIDSDLCRQVLELLQSSQMSLWVFDATSDIGIPCFLAFIDDRLAESDHIGQGAGCHPSRDVALLRALTEAVQVRTTYIAGSREDLTSNDYAPSVLAARRSAVQSLFPHGKPLGDFAQVKSFDFADFASEVDWILARLSAAGFAQALLVDLAHPGSELSVVRAVVPGLEGSDHLPDYQPGPRARRSL